MVRAQSAHDAHGDGAAGCSPGLQLLRGCPGNPAGKRCRGAKDRRQLCPPDGPGTPPDTAGPAPRPGRSGGNWREENAKEPRSSSLGATAHGAARTRGAGPSPRPAERCLQAGPAVGAGPIPHRAAAAPVPPPLTGLAREGGGGSCPLHRPSPPRTPLGTPKQK